MTDDAWVVLREHEAVLLEAEVLPDAMAALPLSRHGSGLLNDAVAVQTRAAGIVLVLDPSEAVSLAWRLRDVGLDVAEEPLGAGDDIDEDWPYWQTRPCPSWCAVEHSDEHRIEDRRHDTEWPPDLQLGRWSSVMEGDPSVEVTGWMPVAAAYAVVRLSVDRCVWSLRTEEALLLAEQLQEWGRRVDPTVSSDKNFAYEEPDFPDPVPPPPRMRELCPMSGQDAGRMIDIPGMDDWNIKCPTCGMTWAGGGTVLDRHYKP